VRVSAAPSRAISLAPSKPPSLTCCHIYSLYISPATATACRVARGIQDLPSTICGPRGLVAGGWWLVSGACVWCLVSGVVLVPLVLWSVACCLRVSLSLRSLSLRLGAGLCWLLAAGCWLLVPLVLVHCLLPAAAATSGPAAWRWRLAPAASSSCCCSFLAHGTGAC
jgi:hypothetical protein